IKADSRTIYEIAMKDQREAFITVFRQKNFSERLTALAKSGHVPSESPTWRWVSGQMRNTGRTFRKEIKSMVVTVESNVFEGSAELHEASFRIWKEVRAVVDLE
ncbi:hypothetical protein HK405_005578, partial [Cladochytrium tenue]